MLIVPSLILIVILCYYYLLKPQLYWRYKNVQQGWPLPILGNTLKTLLKIESRTDFLIRIYREYNNSRYFGIYQAMLPTLVVRDPDLFKQIQVKDFEYFMDHQSFGIDELEPVWNKNLVVLSGQEWKDMRATLSPFFTSSKIRMMFELVQKSAKQYVDFYLQRNENVIELELKDSFARVANDIIANCAFGITVDSLKDPKNDFYQHGKDAMDFSGFWKGIKFMIMLFFPTISNLLKFTIFRPATINFFRTIVGDTVRLREEKNIVRPDIINLMMEARKGKVNTDDSSRDGDKNTKGKNVEIGNISGAKQIALTDEDIAAQVLIFLFAGFETISTLLSFVCYELAVNQDIQEKLRLEVDAINKETNNKLTYENLNSMKYMDMVVSEGLRKYPPGSVTDRICTKPYTIQPVKSTESPLELNVGDVIWFPLIGLQRDEDYFPNPDKFDPERFSNENKGKILAYTYFPFGTGPRNCIGSRFALMEVKLVLFNLLIDFELIVVKKTLIPMEYDKKSKAPAMAGGFWVGYKRRQRK